MQHVGTEVNSLCWVYPAACPYTPQADPPWLTAQPRCLARLGCYKFDWSGVLSVAGWIRSRASSGPASRPPLLTRSRWVQAGPMSGRGCGRMLPLLPLLLHIIASPPTHSRTGHGCRSGVILVWLQAATPALPPNQPRPPPPVCTGHGRGPGLRRQRRRARRRREEGCAPSSDARPAGTPAAVIIN